MINLVVTNTGVLELIDYFMYSYFSCLLKHLYVYVAHLFISMHIIYQVLLRADCLYTHKPAFNLTTILILSINVKVTIFNS